MRKTLWVLAVGASMLTGCATNLQAVRGFADETKKISVAFDPFLAGAVEQCQRRDALRNIYTSSRPLAQFDPATVAQRAEATCKPIADENSTAHGLSTALADYADQLSAIAGDGVASSVDNDYDALAQKLGQFRDFPQDKIGAVSSLLKFLTRAVISKAQKQEIAQALSHEEAVGALGDALVLYTERVYGGYVKDRTRDIQNFQQFIREGGIQVPELVGRLQLMELHQEELQLRQQAAAIPALRRSVDQMKASLRDLRANLDNLSAAQRRQEIQKLAKEVRALYQQLGKVF